MNEAKAVKVSPAGFLITLAGAVLFSTKAIIVKSAFADTHARALTLLTLRMIFSLPFYLGMAVIAGKKEPQRLSRKQWLYMLVLGLLGYYVSSFFDFEGLQYISAGLERLILFLFPSFTVMLNFFVFKQKIHRMQLIALVLTYTGIIIAYVGELHVDTGTPAFYLGSLLVFICSVTYAMYITGSGRIIPVVGATTFTAYAMLAATAGVFIHFSITGNFHELAAQHHIWQYGLLLAIVATVIPSLLLSYGLKLIGSNNVAIISGIGPVSTILQAHYVLGEKIYLQQIAGTVLVITGVILTGWKRRK